MGPKLMPERWKFSPGRYYASYALKLILAHILMRYDFELMDVSNAGTQSFSWRSAMVPRSSTALRFCERKR